MMVLSAPRGRGKSKLISNLVLDCPKLMTRFDWIFILTPSHEFNDDYDDILDAQKEEEDPRIKFVTHVTTETVSEIVEEQARVARGCNRKRRMSEHPESNTCPRGLLIFDDCVDSGAISFRSVMDMVAMRGRHLKVSCIVGTQRIKSISISIRDNADYFLFFSPFTVAELETFLESFVSKDKAPDLRRKLEDVFAREHAFIFVDNHAPICERIQYSIAQDFIKFKSDVLHLESRDATKKKVEKIQLPESRRARLHYGE